jgi:hypothetical protein
VTKIASGSATEVAQVWSRLVVDLNACPREAANDLRDLLGHGLAGTDIGTRRQARLGLLLDLIAADDSGEYITTSVYDQARAKRLAKGEDWPDSSTLCRAYGHWLAAVRAATRFWFDGGRAGGSPARGKARSSKRYEPRDILCGLIAFWREHGAWPTTWEWDEYVAIRREFARRAGKECLLPVRSTIRKAYGSFEGAVTAARSKAGD